MPFYGKRRAPYKKRPKSTKKRATKRRSVSAPIKRYVNSVVHKNIENKVLIDKQFSQTICSYFNNTSLLTLNMLPYGNFTGTGQSSRIGNVITTRKVMFSFVLRPAPYDSVFNQTVVPQHVYLMFGKVKNSAPIQPLPGDYLKLFQTGNASTAPTGYLLDDVLPINNDYFTVYKRLTLKVGWQFNSSGSAGPSNANAQYYTNNDFKMNIIRKIDITKYMPKTVKFNDSTSQPTNAGLYMWAFCNPCDNSSTLNNSRPVLIDYVIHYEYEDA